MKERPINLKSWEVKAILEGRKTMTRRIVKFNEAGRVARGGKQWHIDDPSAVQACPYGRPGDRLWVKEAWKTNSVFNGNPPSELPAVAGVFYLADPGYSPDHARYRHARFMPRWASRITLEVKGVRVERLQDISETDAMAEGVERWVVGDDGWRDYMLTPDEEATDAVPPMTAKQSFKTLWESINGAGSWDANPCVWVIEFKRIEQQAMAA